MIVNPVGICFFCFMETRITLNPGDKHELRSECLYLPDLNIQVCSQHLSKAVNGFKQAQIAVDGAKENIRPENVPIRVGKPWGYEIWFAWTNQYLGKILHVNKGFKLSLQYHDFKDECSYLQSGRLLLTQGEAADKLTVTEIGPEHTWRNEVGIIHTIEALEDSDVLEVSTPFPWDVVRLDDHYGRTGTNKP